MNAKMSQQGVGLIEILISLVVVAIGLLGLAALQGKAQYAEMESYQRSQALFLLQDMAGRLRANRADRENYKTIKADCSNNTTTNVGKDLCDWSKALKGDFEKQGSASVGGMIGGMGCITGGGNAFVVTVAWQGLAAIAQTMNNICGEDDITNPQLRRTLSIPVRFFDTGS